MTPIVRGHSTKLGLRKPDRLTLEDSFVLIAMAFPMPSGTTAWRCLAGTCAPMFMSSRELAWEFAEDHARKVHDRRYAQ